MNGKAIQIMEDDGLVSIAGYSPMIDTAPMDGINFQLHPDIMNMWTRPIFG